jgi:hypothetical protein
MAKEKTREKRGAPAPERSFEPLGGWKWMGVAVFVLLLFYFTPLLSPNATIQWDAVDVHYSSQKYFGDHMREGQWPFWTPLIFGGFPILADPQVGAFYPLNWPFFLTGISPGSIQAELALHSLIALCGAFLLLRRLSGHVAGAMTGALAYALGGFFAAHSSHVGMFQGAALLPCLLYSFERALERSALKWLPAMAGITGCIFLAGHLQTALYALIGLALYAAWRVSEQPGRWTMAVITVAAATALGTALAAVMILPGMELAGESIRAGADYGSSQEGTLGLGGGLGTLVHPNAAGTFSGARTPGTDVTQVYYYAGFLLLPLAGLALRRRGAQVLCGLMVVLPAWYMLGPAAGLYRAGAMIPYLHQMRAPVHLWFVASMGLAILAAFGVGEAEQRWKKPWLGLALLVVFAVDLCQFNSWSNPLTYGRASYDALYGEGEKALRFKVGPEVKSPFRLHVPDRLPVFGSLNSTLTTPVESTYGYNPLELAAWADYKMAAQQNHRLIDGLAVMIEVDARNEQVKSNQTVAPRAYFAPRLSRVSSMAESKARLAGLSPAEESVVLGLPDGISPDPFAKAESMQVLEGKVAIRYTAASPSLLRLADAWYPGWVATAAGKPLEVLRVNHALMGVVVPAGSHEVVFEYKPRRFRAGAMISGGALLLLLLLWGLSWRKKTEGAGDDGVGA